ncbi:uncharacterized protein UTRI_02708_B [Ustilago trichophora]|uniref:Flavoprotein domain-containing protein n=1 Tax=Ustilago trichophora TaxID=86804 RepID=A0A5C3E395_9BASI|nr:uncharacterized protein UTRI_02708_B [Ustilago trichophora]
MQCNTSTSSLLQNSNSIPSPSFISPHPSLSNPPKLDRPLHIVLASTGSVASVKIPLIVEELLKYENVRIQIIASDNSLHFYNRSQISCLNTLYSPPPPPSPDSSSSSSSAPYNVESLAAENSHPLHHSSSNPRVHLWTNSDEWTSFSSIGDPILHIELRRWADLVIVAPCSANTLAKFNGGICDDLLTSFMRALGSDQKVWICPAMNSAMWMHPLTAKHLGMVKETLGYEVMGPIEKILACGDNGIGAMIEWNRLVQEVVERYGLVIEREKESRKAQEMVENNTPIT